MKSPLLLRLAESLTKRIHDEHAIGDVAEEYDRLASVNRWTAQWWLLRQVVGLLWYHHTSNRKSRERGLSPTIPGRRFAAGIPVGLETWLQDTRFGIRMLARDPIVAFTVIATLCLGIGATATMYSITRGILRGLPFEDSDRIVAITLSDLERGNSNLDVPLVDFEAWRDVQTTMQDIAAVDRRPFQFAPAAGAPVLAEGAAVSPWAFSLLGVKPSMGRAFRDSESRTDDSEVVIGYQLWQTALGGKPDVLGQLVRLDGNFRTIVGVMPDGFGFPRAEQLWIPLLDHTNSAEGQRGTMGQSSAMAAVIFGRIRPDANLSDARAEFAVLHRPSRAELPQEGRREAVDVQLFTHRFVGSDANALLYTMLAIVSSVLLIACANVINLLMARATVREREIAVRAALGSSRRRLARQLLTETLIMATLGSLAGVACALVAVRWFNLTVGHRIDFFWVSISVDVAVLAFVTGLTGLTTLLVGIVPALRGTRLDINQALRQGTTAGGSLRTGTVTRVLVIGEIAISVVLLVASGLMVKGVAGLASRDVQFDATEVLTARIRLGSFDYVTDESLTRFYRALQQTWSERQGGTLALTSAPPGRVTGRWNFAVGGVPYTEDANLPASTLRFISDEFLSMFELAASAGRVFDSRDHLEGRPVAIVNATFAETHLDGAPIGQTIRIGDLSSGEPWREIVGVVDDRGVTLEEGHRAPGIFVPLAQSPRRALTITIRHTGMSQELAATALRETVLALDANLPLYDGASLERLLTDEISPQRTFAILFAVFGAAALLLASVGLYGTMSFSVAQRQREFGVRRALGARSTHLALNLLRSVGWQLAAGLVFGVALASLIAPLMRDFTFGVNPRDPVVFSVVLTILIGTTTIAAIVPTRRAAHADPMRVLRNE